MVRYTICRMGYLELDLPSAAEPTTHFDAPLYIGDGDGWTGLNAKNFKIKTIGFTLYPPANMYDSDYPDRLIRVGLEPATIDGVIDFSDLEVTARLSAFNKLPFLASGPVSTTFTKTLTNEAIGLSDAFPVTKLNVENGKVVNREPAPQNLSSAEILNVNNALYQVGVLHIMATYESLKMITSAKDDPFDVVSSHSPASFNSSVENARKRMQQRGQTPQPTRGKYRFNVEIKYGIEYTPADERTK